MIKSRVKWSKIKLDSIPTTTNRASPKTIQPHHGVGVVFVSVPNRRFGRRRLSISAEFVYQSTEEKIKHISLSTKKSSNETALRS